MDPVRVGLSLRALRRRRRLTQERLAGMIGLSRPTIARIERGGAEAVTVRTLVRVAGALGATLNVRVLWHGEALDRLLDASHADLTDAVLRLLRDAAWEVATEVSFNVHGERGTIDILAFHAETGSLLVIEIKSVVPDLQAMLGTLDRKDRASSSRTPRRDLRDRTPGAYRCRPTVAHGPGRGHRRGSVPVRCPPGERSSAPRGGPTLPSCVKRPGRGGGK